MRDYNSRWCWKVPENVAHNTSRTYTDLLCYSYNEYHRNSFKWYGSVSCILKPWDGKGSQEVLDLYVYNLGIGDGNIPLSTVVGMTKSIISVILLFLANGISKLIRGENIV